MIEVSLNQFVPSHVCLQCDGCCRFKTADSPWRPKLGKTDQQSLATLITSGGIWDDAGYVKTIQSCGEHVCQFFNTKDHTCRVYTQRPFECSLYPFILSQSSSGPIEVHVHLSCPFVQDHQSSPEFGSYVDYLKSYFARTDVRDFLKRNKAMLHDYTPYTMELLYLFNIPAL